MTVDITLRQVKGAPLTFNEVDDNFSNLKAAADSASGDLSAIESDVSGIDARLTTAEGEIDVIQSNATTLTGRVNAIEADYTTEAESEAIADNAIAAHVALADPHTQYLTGAESVNFAATKAAGDTLAASLPDGATVIVTADESQGGVRVRYTVASAALTAGVVDTAVMVQFTQPETGAVPISGQAALQTAAGDFGDYSVDNNLFIFCGDSTTEQMGGNGYGFDRLTSLRGIGELWEKVLGTINFGGSGYTINGFVNDAAGTTPTVSTSNLGVGNWDYYGHKPAGFVSLATSLVWRAGKADRVTWVLCYGINDCILNASVGNMSQADITSYIAERLHKAITTIQGAYPKDKIVLRVPNPMTARPYDSGAGFPSPGQYPSFGSNLAADQALVEKWNQALRNAYLAVRNKNPATVLFDTWSLVFGNSDTTMTAATQLPFLGDLVHPSTTGYTGIVNALVNLLPGGFKGSYVRRFESDLRALALANNPWENYPSYFQDNPYFKVVAGETGASGLVAVGSNFIDLGITLTKFYQQVDTSKPIYIVLGNKAAQKFTSYSLSAVGQSTRLFSISVSSAMQAGVVGGNAFIFQDTTIQLVANDVFVHNTTKGQKEIFAGNIVSAGSGFIDINLNSATGRMSSKFPDGVYNATLAVGGTIQTTLALTTASSVSINGTPAQRTIRVLISGSYSSWAGSPAAIYFSDSVPSPKSFEDLVINGTTDATPGTQTVHAHGLGYRPRRIQLLPTSNGVVYQSATADATNIYVKGSAASLTFIAYVK